MKLPRHLRFAALVLIAIRLGIPFGMAQTASPSPGGLPVPAYPGKSVGGGGGGGGGGAPAEPGVPVEDPGPRMDFAFTSLPLVEAIKSIQTTYWKAATPKRLNVVVGEHLRELGQTNTVTLDVRQVTVGEVLNLLGLSSQRRVLVPAGINNLAQGRAGYTFISAGSSGGNPTYLLQSDFPATYESSGAGSGFQGVPGIPGPGSAPIQKLVAYFSVEPFLDSFKVEDITTAIKLGWDLLGMKEPPIMKFHEETKLLIVSGDPLAMEVVSKVLENLSRKPGQPSSPVIQRPLPVPAAKP